MKSSNSVGENLNALETQVAALSGGVDLTALSSRIGNLDRRVNKVGAGAAALAALHPIEADSKLSMGMGIGHYRNANAMALGLYYRPKDNVLIGIGGAMGNGENMINAGVTFALDKGVNSLNTSKASMARKIKAQDEKIATLEGENAEQKAEIQALKEALARIEAKLGK